MKKITSFIHVLACNIFISWCMPIYTHRIYTQYLRAQSLTQPAVLHLTLDTLYHNITMIYIYIIQCHFFGLFSPILMIILSFIILLLSYGKKDFFLTSVIMFSIFILISFALYCCIRCGSLYDKEMEDLEQEKFLQNREQDYRIAHSIIPSFFLN